MRHCYWVALSSSACFTLWHHTALRLSYATLLLGCIIIIGVLYTVASHCLATVICDTVIGFHYHHRRALHCGITLPCDCHMRHCYWVSLSSSACFTLWHHTAL